MARKFKLNTTGFPTITQIVVATPSGAVYDHKKLEAAGIVDLGANERDANAVRQHVIGGIQTTTET